VKLIDVFPDDYNIRKPETNCQTDNQKECAAAGFNRIDTLAEWLRNASARRADAGAISQQL